MITKLSLNNKNIVIVWPRAIKWSLNREGGVLVLSKSQNGLSPTPIWNLRPDGELLQATHGAQLNQYLFETSGGAFNGHNFLNLPAFTAVEIHKSCCRFHTGAIARFLVLGGDLPDINEANILQVRATFDGKHDVDELSPLGLALYQRYVEKHWVSI